MYTIKIEINAKWENFFNDFAFPIEGKETLDETLDYLKVDFFLNDDKWSETFKPFSKALLCEYETNKVLREYVLIEDTCEKYFALEGDGWKHTTAFCEPTKLLEREICDNITHRHSINSANGSISTFINRVLDITPTRRIDQLPKYKLVNLTTKLRSRLNKIMPEDSFCNMNLRELLKKVGKLINGEPRLVNFDTITFDLFDDEQMYDFGDKTLTDEKQFQWGEYASESLDTTLQNVVCNNSNQAMVYHGWVTPRVSEGIKLEDISACIKLPYPIFEIKRVRVANFVVRVKKVLIYENGELKENYNTIYPLQVSTPYAFDVSKNVLNEKQFNLLNSSQKVKNFHYTKGGDIIDLSYRQKRFLSTASAFTEVLKSKIASNKVGLLNPVIKSQLGSGYQVTATTSIEGVSADFSEMQFFVEYIPFAGGRYKTIKDNALREGVGVGSQVLNQDGGLIDINRFGEMAKASANRLGNNELELSYMFSLLSELPKCGNIIKWREKKYMVTKIEWRIEPHHIIATILAVKDFNKLNEKTGIDRQRILHNIPNEDIVDRHMNYSYCCKIDFSSGGSGGLNTFLSHYVKTFTQTHTYPVTTVRVHTQNANIEKKFILPTIASSFGNSVAINFGFEDNYSAGKRVSGDEQFDSQYVDSQGKLFVMRTKLLSGNFTRGVADGKNLPQCDTEKAEILSTSVFVYKDAGERITFTQQLHHLSLNEDIVIGSALTNNNSLVSPGNLSKKAYLYSLSYRPTYYDEKIDMARASKVSDLSFTASGNTLFVKGVNSGARAEHFAIASADGSVLFTINRGFEKNAQICLSMQFDI